MKYCVGIDLGSTTTKAVILDEGGAVLGRGITNSRSNYKVACDVALGEALINTRFALVAHELAEADVMGDHRPSRAIVPVQSFREPFVVEIVATAALGGQTLG